MNAVNLIPADARRRRTTISASPITLALIGVLAAALGAALLYVSTVNKATARTAELSSVNASVASWQAAANSFSSLEAAAAQRQAQLAQVRTLADGRYAWAQLLSQIGGLMPAKAALSSLQATTASSSAATTSSSTPATTTTAATPTVPLPSISLTGCASSQPMVAKTMEQLHKITGVSDVSLASSTDSGASGGSGGSAGSGGSGGCPFPITFQVSLTFSAPSAGPRPPRPGPRRHARDHHDDDACGHAGDDARHHHLDRSRAMKLRGRDRILLGVVAVIALFGAFYMLALKPERQKVSSLDAQIATARSSLVAAQQSYTTGKRAQAALKANDQEWAAIHLAVPNQSDIPALLRTLQSTADAVHVHMQSITLTGASSTGTAAATPTPATPATPATPGATTAPAVPTATPVPVQLTFAGGYRALDTLVRQLNSLVVVSHGKLHATGPLMSISTVSLTGSGKLAVQISASLYQLSDHRRPVMSSLRRDLLERKLWIIVAALIAAVVAVPVLLLKSASATTAPLPAPPAAATGATTSTTSQTSPRRSRPPRRPRWCWPGSPVTRLPPAFRS